MQCRECSCTVLHHVLAKIAKFRLCCSWDSFISNMFWILLDNFSLMGYCFFSSTFYSLLRQVSLKLTTVATILIQYITVKHTTISSHSLMSLLRHTHRSSNSRVTALLFGDKRFVWWFHCLDSAWTDTKHHCWRSDDIAEVVVAGP